jgi:hypothetical protein
MGNGMTRAVVVVVLAWAVMLAWRWLRVEQLPPRPIADVGTVKQDLLVFARAERAYYASAGHYAPMEELRTVGLLSLPPEMRWPYSYYVVVRGPERFVVIAMSQGQARGGPLALAVDEQMNMRELDRDSFPAPRHHRRRRLTLAT